MYIRVLLVVALFPVYFLLTMVNKLDKVKEPKKLLYKLLFGGAFISVLMTFILTFVAEEIFGDFYTTLDTAKNGINVFLNYFLFVGLIEEFSKFVVIMLFGYKDKAFDEEYDGIVYSIFSSLGFAGLENLLYVFSGGVGTGITRAVLSIPGHACFGFAMGIFITQAKIMSVKKNKKGEKLYLVLALLVPAILHCIYDSCLSINELRFMAIFYIYVVILNVVAVIACIYISKKSSFFVKNQTSSVDLSNYNYGFCPDCKQLYLNNNYCINCGRNLKDENTSSN